MGKVDELFGYFASKFSPPENFEENVRVSISSLLELHQSVDDDNFSDEFEDLKNLLEEYICWMYCVCLYTHINIIGQELGNEEKNKAKCIILIVGAICSFGLSVRSLVLSGFDVSAKQITRSIREYVDAFTLVAFDAKAMMEFLETDTPESDNRFWYKYISKGKAKNILLNHIFDGSVPKDYLEWRNEEDSILSMSAHPSYMACFASVLPGYSIDGDNERLAIPLFTKYSAASKRTIKYCLFSFFDLISVFRLKFKYLYEHQAEDKFSESLLWNCKNGPDVLGSLFFAVVYKASDFGIDTRE